MSDLPERGQNMKDISEHGHKEPEPVLPESAGPGPAEPKHTEPEHAKLKQTEPGYVKMKQVEPEQAQIRHPEPNHAGAEHSGQEESTGDSAGGKKAVIRETIVRTESSGPKKPGLRILIGLGLAAAFGIVASLAFVLSRPLWEKSFATTTETETITIPRDETTEAPTTTAPPETTPRETSSQVQIPEVESIVSSMLEERTMGLGDWENMQKQMEQVAADARPCLVTLLPPEEDLSDEEFVSRQGNTWAAGRDTAYGYPGAVIAQTDTEYLVLVPSWTNERSPQMTVVFENGERAEAALKASDHMSRLAVYSVEKKELDPEAEPKIGILPLGDSYLVGEGTQVISVGSPLGVNGSSVGGQIAYVNREVEGADRQVRLFITDISTTGTGSGFLLNFRGEVIGIITSKYSEDGQRNLLAAESISDLKGFIEKMSNGVSPAYLGIRAGEISEDMAEVTGMPVGLFITSCDTDGPAYLAGIQRGDILTQIDHQEIRTMRELQRLLEERNAGNTIVLTVMREGRDGYIEMDFAAELGTR